MKSPTNYFKQIHDASVIIYKHEIDAIGLYKSFAV